MEVVSEILLTQRADCQKIVFMKKPKAEKALGRKSVEPSRFYLHDGEFVFVLPEIQNAEALRKAGASVVDYCVSNSITTVHLDVSEVKDKVSILVGIRIASYYFEMKSKPKPKSLSISVSPFDQKLAKLSQKQATIFSAVNFVRELVNSPANVIGIEEFVKIVSDKLSGRKHVKIEVLDEPKLKKLGMNLIISVCKGSANRPKLMIIEYCPLKKKEFDLALVGKGVIFDSGGLSLKPAKSMENMKDDMSGAATVMGIVMAAADLGLKKNVLAIAPLVENMPGCAASKPGDIVAGYSGKTVEILNTDAEGRLILADALAYACKNYKFKKLVDFATLTGACVIALGQLSAAILGTDQQLISKLEKSGQETGEHVWQLPLWDDYSEFIKSKYADIKNIGSEGAGAGTITAACFLKEFVDSPNWAHIDIAGTAFLDGKLKYYGPGATGFGVRLIINYIDKGY